MSVEDFWKRTSDLIKDKHLTRKEFSSACGFTERRIESLVNGKRYPDLEEVYAIAKQLGVDIEYLCGEEKIEAVNLGEIFWTNVNLILRQRKETQTDFASELNVGIRTYQDWVYSKRIPEIEKVKKIADTLGVTVDFLLTGSNKKSATDEREKVIIDCYRKMSEKVRKTFINTAIYFSNVNSSLEVQRG